MYVDLSPVLNSPDERTVLWRYMKLVHFKSLLERRAIRFARLCGLPDPYEGMPTKPMVERLCKIPKKASLLAEARRKQIADRNASILMMGRELYCVSCWYAADQDSDAMWKIYAGSEEGVAIRTTFGRFRDSFTEEFPQVHGGMVTYEDHQSHEPRQYNLLEVATLKEPAYEHEHEFRGILQDPQNARQHVFVSVDLSVLISDIYVGPTASASFSESIRGLCLRYELDVTVKRSKLLELPAYIVERQS